MMKLMDDDHCKCPKCGSEVWFNYNAPNFADDGEPKMKFSNQYISRSLPEGYRVPPGGAKTGKRARKKGTKTYTDDIGYGG